MGWAYFKPQKSPGPRHRPFSGLLSVYQHTGCYTLSAHVCAYMCIRFDPIYLRAGPTSSPEQHPGLRPKPFPGVLSVFQHDTGCDTLSALCMCVYVDMGFDTTDEGLEVWDIDMVEAEKPVSW